MGKLREQMKADLTLKGYSERTHEAYLRYLRGFAKHFMRSPAYIGEEEVRAFLLHLVEEQKADPYLQKAHISALKFFYRSTVRYLHVSNAYLSHIESPFDALRKGEENRQGGQPCKQKK